MTLCVVMIKYIIFSKPVPSQSFFPRGVHLQLVTVIIRNLYHYICTTEKNAITSVEAQDN